MFDNSESWFFISIALCISLLFWAASYVGATKAEAAAQVKIEAIKAGLVQDQNGYWVKASE